ncbi:MAG: hypothetical protein ACPG4Z_03285 [Chitinophagales bacterium]
MKSYILVATLLFSSWLFAQDNLSVTFNDETDDVVTFLLDDKQTIKDDNILNELLVDAVVPYTTDSTYKRKTERHQLIGGAFIRILGYRWKTVKHTREKLVGTIIRSSIPGSEEAKFTEYDVNYNLVPHLEKYLNLSYESHLAQTEMFKSRTKKKMDQAPYIAPNDTTNPDKYQIHCECTPHEDFRLALNTTFYPVMRPMTLEQHPNFQEPHPTVGMYGPLVLDCNHTCHPEIHPYEWIWWYDLTDVESTEQVWHIGFLRDNSNRFKHWSSSPRTGVITIPFAFPIESSDWTINIDHQLFNGFDEEKINELDLPENFKNFDQTEWNYELNGTYQNIKVTSSQIIASTGIGYWVDGINMDSENGIVSGTFYLAMANDDVYTAEMTTSHQLEEEALD